MKLNGRGRIGDGTLGITQSILIVESFQADRSSVYGGAPDSACLEQASWSRTTSRLRGAYLGNLTIKLPKEVFLGKEIAAKAKTYDVPEREEAR